MTAPVGSNLGRFRVESILGEGGMGVVLRAYDPQLQRPVAIKVLTGSTEHVEGTTIDLRVAPGMNDLLAEARALAQIRHPNVLAVHEIGNERGKTFLVMELVEGMHLRRWLEAAPRSLDEICRVFVQAGNGLAAAHRRELIHRDFKPENVLIDGEGRIHVCDFGIAAMARIKSATRDGRAGTPQYMAPELWKGAPASVQSDVFAFGLTLAEAIIGKLPTDQLSRELQQRGVGEPLRAAIARAIDPDPAKRPASIDELVAVLEAQPRPRRRAWLYAAAGLAACGLAAGAFVVTRESSGCGDTSSLVSARWSDADRAAVRAATGSAADTIVGKLDRYATAWSKLRDDTCRADLPADRRAARMACLERRLYELGSITRALKGPPNASSLTRADSLQDLASCIDAKVVLLPASSAARAAIEEITAKSVAIMDEALSRPGSGDRPALAELEQQAEALGDWELVVRLKRNRAFLVANSGDMAKAEAMFQATYEVAAAHQLDASAGSALVQAARIAANRGDYGGAASKLEIARMHLDRAPEAPVLIRLTLDQQLAIVSLQRGELAKAQEALDRARASLGRLDPPNPMLEGELEVRRAELLVNQGKLADALVVARNAETKLVAIGAQAVPHLSDLLGVVISIHQQRGDRASALATALRHVELLEKHRKPDDAALVYARGQVGVFELEAGNYERAIDVFDLFLDRSQTIEALVKWRPRFYAQRGDARRQLGQFDDARREIQRAIDETRVLVGARDHGIGRYEIGFAEVELDAGDLARAATHLRIAEDILADLPAEHINRRELATMQIDLLFARGDYAAADKLAAQGVQLFAERKIDDVRAETAWLAHAHARLMLGDPKGAGVLADRAAARRRARTSDQVDLAVADVVAAQAQHDAGDPAALARVRALEVTLRDPRARRTRARVLAWFAARKLKP